MKKRRCTSGKHEVLLIEDFTTIGMAVACLRCGYSFHLSEPVAETFYTPFTHHSVKGEKYDVSILLHDDLLK